MVPSPVTDTWAEMLPALLASGGPGGVKLPSVIVYTLPLGAVQVNEVWPVYTLVTLAFDPEKLPRRAVQIDEAPLRVGYGNKINRLFHDQCALFILLLQ